MVEIRRKIGDTSLTSTGWQIVSWLHGQGLKRDCDYVWYMWRDFSNNELVAVFKFNNSKWDTFVQLKWV